MSNPVDGPLSCGFENIPVFNNTAGNLLADSGVNINTGTIIADGIELNYLFGINDIVSFEYTEIHNPGLISHYGIQSANGPTYDVGTFTQSGYTITGTGTTWTQDMVGGLFVNDHGGSTLIKQVVSATQLTVDKSVSDSGSYIIYYEKTSISGYSIGAKDIITPNLSADTVTEKTSNSGCTLDGLLIKDGCQAPTVNSTTYSFTNTTGTLNIKLQKISSNIVIMTVPDTTLTKTTSSGYIITSTSWPSDYIPSATQRFFPVADSNGTRQVVSVSLNSSGQLTIAKDITGSTFSSSNTFAFSSSGEQTFEYHL